MKDDTTIHLTLPCRADVPIDHAILAETLAAYGVDVPPGTDVDGARALWAAASREEVLAAWDRRVGARAHAS